MAIVVKNTKSAPTSIENEKNCAQTNTIILQIDSSIYFYYWKNWEGRTRNKFENGNLKLEDKVGLKNYQTEADRKIEQIVSANLKKYFTRINETVWTKILRFVQADVMLQTGLFHALSLIKRSRWSRTVLWFLFYIVKWNT